ncbi:glycosyltransferase family 25 protein [Aeromonas cavernicola]|uniref:LPS biosynthesis glycosyltransferase n=1 Tax=Aeromonas cavernicola TaxID=1006623 RepID=A0A2H9U8H2_9GAMM|nr:glycosyltransferase family 25 protein [Aeromonas cavernicola]PJG60298.1 LPS biosynthesis glycosyltransferase [Aeromonas cavernicola]
MIPIFVISLIRSADRRASVTAQMANLGLPFEFWDAVDGKKLDPETIAQVDFAEAQRFCGHKLSLGEVGCALSHIRLCEMLVAKQIPRAIILEDDVYLHMHFKEIVNSACHKSDADIIFLIHGKAKSWPWKKTLPEGYRLASYVSPSKASQRGIMSTAGYILTLQGAQKILKHAYPVRMPADYLTGRLQLNKLTAVGVEPCCVDVNIFSTTIDDRDYGQHIVNPVNTSS